MSHKMVSSKAVFPILRCLLAVSCMGASLLGQSPGERPILHARVVLGLEGVANNSMGDLSTQDDALVFSRPKGVPIRVPLSAIQGAFLSEEDKQVGGIPMAVGRAATPFGGGRLIGLFSHKKYDFLTLESFDENGGFHGTIYQLNKGQGEAFASELAAKGVHVSGRQIDVAKSGVEANNVK